MAGCLRKDNGLWRITNLGREALREHPGPGGFCDFAKSTPAYVNRNRHGFAYAARLVGAIPAGSWLALDDLCGATGLERAPLSRWLWGSGRPVRTGCWTRAGSPHPRSRPARRRRLPCSTSMRST